MQRSARSKALHGIFRCQTTSPYSALLHGSNLGQTTHRIGWWENFSRKAHQIWMAKHAKTHGFPVQIFPTKPIHWTTCWCSHPFISHFSALKPAARSWWRPCLCFQVFIGNHVARSTTWCRSLRRAAWLLVGFLNWWRWIEWWNLMVDLMSLVVDCMVLVCFGHVKFMGFSWAFHMKNIAVDSPKIVSDVIFLFATSGLSE